MLTITIGARKDVWNSDTERFESLDRDWTIQLEHSLISISKWEAKHKKPYLSPTVSKTPDEVLDYIKCMTITPNVDPEAYKFLTNENLHAIENYINDPMSATWFNEDNARKKFGNKGGRQREIMTSELIYYYMIANDVPWEAQKWHINRLLTLIRICGDKNADAPKMSKKDIIGRNASLNKARRMALGSKG